MELLSFAYLVTGLLLGYLISHFHYRSRRGLSGEEADRLQQEREEAGRLVSRLEERNANLESESRQYREQMVKEQERANRAERQIAEMGADERNLRKQLDKKEEEMKSLQDHLREEFENLANRILDEKSKKFTEQNREKLDQLLKPLGEKLEAFRNRVEETHKEDLKGRSSLEQHLKHLHDLNQQITKETRDLTNALKGDTKTQGNWGEVILQRILEKSGLRRGREYEIQKIHPTDDGRRLQPDVVVNLPDEKRLIVDSKVSLKAYEKFCSSEEKPDREAALKEHVHSIRNHVKGLSAKNYQQLYGGNSPDFVLMFIPIESAFGLALQCDSELYYEAFEKNIVIVSPSTLLATLATIDSVWKQEYQSKNAKEIAERGGALYDKFVLFAESMEGIGSHIRKTQEEYDQAMNRLSAGRGNVIRQVEMLRELGARTDKKLPDNLVEPKQLTNGE